MLNFKVGKPTVNIEAKNYNSKSIIIKLEVLYGLKKSLFLATEANFSGNEKQ